ncbi:MAG TPA: tRNA glutamyl-Q(34) synthetase GluQRS [Thermoanaerobaculia bacterium]|nr:tRNA glutamyl-Q(34) synthetase GluQRS [Thermoanaerobaculia bacterium]
MTHDRRPPAGAAGRFAPSPTGPLHHGSLVAAAGSWLFARAAGGRWLVRMEDLDRPRVVEGADRQILDALRRYGLEWDGEVVYQSQRTHLYDDALRQLREKGQVFDCVCSRSELQRAASAPAESDPAERIYPGTCRNGLPPGRAARSVRFRGEGVIALDDLVFGHVEEDLAATTGDFVIKRADGVFAYQLAVVVDDEAQGVTQVVRGADLLSSTARQIALQRALGYRTPQYAHLPLVVDAAGAKIGKRNGLHGVGDESLQLALRILGIEVDRGTPAQMLEQALARFDVSKIPRTPSCMNN